MPLDVFEGKVSVRTRDQEIVGWLDSYKLWHPAADTGPKSFPAICAASYADGQMPLYANAEAFGDATSPFRIRGKALDEEATAAGRPRKAATGALGYGVVSTATGGSNVVQGDLAKYKATGRKYAALVSEAVADQQKIIIQAVDTGPDTNLPAGAELEWMSPRPGMSKTLTVFENTDGTGLTGGTNQETDEELQQVLADLRKYPSPGANEAAVIKFVESIPGIAVQKCFVVSCVLGPGTKTVFVTMRPSVAGGSRVPSNAVLELIESQLKDAFPYDDGIFVGTLSESLVAPLFQVTWGKGTPSFADAAPWPALASVPVAVNASPAPTTLTARLTTSVDTTTPAVGQSVGFYNPAARAFVRKVISAVSVVVANRSWDVTFSSAIPTSDTAYTPVAAQYVSPWSDSLASVVEPVLAYFDRQGPGELYASFSDPGRRQRRFPEPEPDLWPSRIENRILDRLFSVVADAEVAAPSVPLDTPVGTPPLLAYIHRCSDIGVVRQT